MAVEVTAPATNVVISAAGQSISVGGTEVIIRISTSMGGGETNVAANVGGAAGEVFRDKIGSVLNFKTIAGADGVTITNGADTITIGKAATADELVLASVADTTAGTLWEKIDAGGGLTRTLINPGGDEDLQLNVVANADGSITVNADDIQVGILATDAQHGNRGGGGIHPVAIQSGAAGFLSGADKQTIDDLGTTYAPVVHAASHAGAGSDPITTLGAVTFTGLIVVGTVDVGYGAGASSTIIGTSALAGGASTVAVGASANAANADCVAIGASATAAGAQGTAVGKSTNAGIDSTAVGQIAFASAQRCVSIGAGSVASSNDSTALGYDAEATAVGAISIGKGSRVGGAASIAIGASSDASGVSAVVIGSSVTAAGEAGVAIGLNAAASGYRSVSIGRNSDATINNSVALGDSAQAAGSSTTALGDASYATLESVAVGKGARASGSASTAIGRGAMAQSAAGGSVAIGAIADCSGSNSIALGARAEVSAVRSIAIGNYADASFTTAIVIGTLSAAAVANNDGVWGSAAYPSDFRMFGKMGIGLGASTQPVNKLDVAGGVVIGAAHAGVDTAPTNGLLVEGDVVAGQNVVAGATYSHSWTGRSQISSPADGQILLQNNAADNFSLLQLGDTTSGFPALGVSSTAPGPGLEVKLADSSGDAYLRSGHIGIAREPTTTHSLIGSSVWVGGDGTRQAVGMFPAYVPGSIGGSPNILYGVQGNVFFGDSFWGASSVVNALQFFPAPDYLNGSTSWGSANLKLIGISTGACINIFTRAITADELTGISASTLSAIFGGAGVVTANAATCLRCETPVQTAGTIGVQTGVQVNPQYYATRNMGIWLAGDNSTIIPPLGGCDIVFGAGKDAAVYYNGTHFIIDPDVAGAGRVYIGATGDDDMLLNDIEIDGDLDHDGAGVGFYGTAPVAKSAGYTPTNVSADRSYDANATTVNELADVLGTLIADLQATGLIG